MLSLIVNLPDERKKISKKTFCMTLYSHTFVLITFKIVKDRDWVKWTLENESSYFKSLQSVKLYHYIDFIISNPRW